MSNLQFQFLWCFNFFVLKENTFEIDIVTGFLTVVRVLDRETDESTYTLTVSARDNGDPPFR